MTISQLRQTVMNEAAALSGIPYRIVPPPDGVSNLDCSLFVITAFRRAGLPFGPGVRIAESIRQACEPIEFKALQAGDLLFFEKTYNADHAPGPDGKIATHVGISCGSGSFKMFDCHASNGESGPPGVGETNLSVPYWQEHLLEARRPPALIGDDDQTDEPVDVDVTVNGQRLRVLADSVRLRANPSLSGSILVELGANTIVVALDDNAPTADGHTWRHVRAGNRDGWVAAMYLATDVPAAGAPGQRLRVTDDGVRLREAPRTSGRILMVLNRGAVVVQRFGETPSSDDHIWLPVTLGDLAGFIAADLVEPASAGGVSNSGNGGDGGASGTLDIAALYTLVRTAGAKPDVDRIMVAAALTESSGNPAMVGDQGHSIGLWQMHDQGLGAGMSAAQRSDPTTACAAMLPHFTQVFGNWSAQGLSGEELASKTYLWTERPFQYNVPGNDAEKVFRKNWGRVAE